MRKQVKFHNYDAEETSHVSKFGLRRHSKCPCRWLLPIYPTAIATVHSVYEHVLDDIPTPFSYCGRVSLCHDEIGRRRKAHLTAEIRVYVFHFVRRIIREKWCIWGIAVTPFS
jgi:hypothetical protein